MDPDINPFRGPEEFSGKDPEDMSLEELKMLLHIKRLNVKLDVERIRSQVSYTKLILDGIRELGLLDNLEEYLPKRK